MKDYQALNPNPSLPVGYVDSVDLISLKIYKLSILSHSKKKNTDVVKKAYRVYRAYSEAWILLLRQISLQNLCRPRGKVYMNPTQRKKCRIASPSGVCDSLLYTFGKRRISIISGFIWKRTQTTQTQPTAAATRRSRSFHSRAAAAAATERC